MHLCGIGRQKSNNRHNSLKIYNTKLMVKNTRDSLVFLTPLKIDIEFLYNDIVFAQILRKSFMNTQ